jgi:hypothetical protein
MLVIKFHTRTRDQESFVLLDQTWKGILENDLWRKGAQTFIIICRNICFLRCLGKRDAILYWHSHSVIDGTGGAEKDCETIQLCVDIWSRAVINTQLECWSLCCGVRWRAVRADHCCDVLYVLITVLRRSVACCTCWSLLWRGLRADQCAATFCYMRYVFITVLRRSVTCCTCLSLYCDVL